MFVGGGPDLVGDEDSTDLEDLIEVVGELELVRLASEAICELCEESCAVRAV